ncbi:MAG: hypothetical protein F2829_18855, partial [Actinobacteria bacterium]|nr:hypothetical protein [Actinomycetota bacterium]
MFGQQRTCVTHRSPGMSPGSGAWSRFSAGEVIRSLQRFLKGSDAMGFVHDLSTRDRFYELVCVDGLSLTAAVAEVGAG